MSTEVVLLVIILGISLYKIYLVTNEIRQTKRIFKTLSNIASIKQSKERLGLVSAFNSLRHYNTDIAIVMYADSHSFPKELVSCLPKLFFEDTLNKHRFILWKEMKNLIPDNYSLKIIDAFCSGQLLQVEISNIEGIEYVRSIAEVVEKARLECPYYSYTSLLGVLNQSLSDLELKALKSNKAGLAETIKAQRRELLSTELHLGV